MVEVHEETTYVRHHKKKIAFLLSAMRHFAQELREDGWQVDYVQLDDDANTGSFRGEVARACAAWAPETLVVTEPGEWRVRADMASWQAMTGVPLDCARTRDSSFPRPVSGPGRPAANNCAWNISTGRCARRPGS